MPQDICSPLDMAKWFINRVDREAGEAMTHLKVQKLIYFAQAYYLANYNRQIFSEDMQAWAHGPVVPSVWHSFKEYSWEAIASQEDPNLSKEIENYLELVYDKFGARSAKELEQITHKHKPWRLTRGDLRPEERCSDPIDKVLIRDFYAKKIKKEWGKAKIRVGNGD